MGVDPRGGQDFVELDSLITAFRLVLVMCPDLREETDRGSVAFRSPRDSIPSGESFAVLQQDGMAIDRDLVIAQALPDM